MTHCFPFLCLRNVEAFDRSRSRLTQVPRDISRYEHSLREVQLQNNQISKLDKILFRCQKLEHLNLNDNNLSEIPQDIERLANLKELLVHKNEIEEIADGIRYCEKLTLLDASNNNLHKLTDAVTQLRSLQVLILNETSLTIIPTTISSLCNLRVLEARDNLIQEIPESVGFLSKLTRLDLGCNEISSLPETFGQLECLTELWLDTNIIYQLSPEIGDLKQLEILELSNNPLQQLTDGICNLTSLTDLTLTSNSLTELPEDIGSLKELRNLKIDFNQLKSLPPSLCRLSNLRELYLSGNCLAALPSDMGQLKSLTCIHADYNGITSLPDSICQCSELSIFSLRDNLLGSLPSEMGGLSKLAVLDVSGNRLNFLPVSLNKLKSIKAIWLSKTQQKSLYSFQIESNSEYGKVLTNFLLPQSHVGGDGPPASSLMSSVDGFRSHGMYVNETLKASETCLLNISESSENPDFPANTNGLEALSAGQNDQEAVFTEGKREDSRRGFKARHNRLELREGGENKGKIVDFSVEVVSLACQDKSVGIEVEQIPSDSILYFGLHQSVVIISSIRGDSQAHQCGRLRIGDRILEVNEIPMALVNSSEAESIIDLHYSALTLRVRHDPSPSNLMVTVVQKEGTQRPLGIDVIGNELDNEYPSLLKITGIDERGAAFSNQTIKVGMWLVEMADRCLIDRSKMYFAQVASQLEGDVPLTLYHPNIESMLPR